MLLSGSFLGAPKPPGHKEARSGPCWDPRSETRRDGGAQLVPATPAPLFLGQPPSDHSPAEPFQTADSQELGEIIK